MRALTLFLLLSAALTAQTRYARLGDLDGAVEIQIHPTQPWRTALRNTPLLESSSVRTGSASHAEIELDEGSVLRLAEDSICELSDYTRLSTGQRITHISARARRRLLRRRVELARCAGPVSAWGPGFHSPRQPHSPRSRARRKPPRRARRRSPPRLRRRRAERAGGPHAHARSGPPQQVRSAPRDRRAGLR